MLSLLYSLPGWLVASQPIERHGTGYCEVELSPVPVARTTRERVADALAPVAVRTLGTPARDGVRTRLLRSGTRSVGLSQRFPGATAQVSDRRSRLLSLSACRRDRRQVARLCVIAVVTATLRAAGYHSRDAPISRWSSSLGSRACALHSARCLRLELTQELEYVGHRRLGFEPDQPKPDPRRVAPIRTVHAHQWRSEPPRSSR